MAEFGNAFGSGVNWGSTAFTLQNLLGKSLGPKLAGTAFASLASPWAPLIAGGAGILKSLLSGKSEQQKRAEMLSSGQLPPGVEQAITNQVGGRFDQIRRQQGADLSRRGLSGSTIAPRVMGGISDSERQALANAIGYQSLQREYMGNNMLAQLDKDRQGNLKNAVGAAFLSKEFADNQKDTIDTDTTDTGMSFKDMGVVVGTWDKLLRTILHIVGWKPYLGVSPVQPQQRRPEYPKPLSPLLHGNPYNVANRRGVGPRN